MPVLVAFGFHSPMDLCQDLQPLSVVALAVYEVQANANELMPRPAAQTAMNLDTVSHVHVYARIM